MQETNLYTITIPPMMKALTALSAILDKAAWYAESKRTPRRNFEEALLSDRIIFDQFPLVQQVQIATDNAKGGAARLAGIEPPKFEDTEKTIAELKARIEKAIEFLETISPEQVAGQEERTIEQRYFPGKYIRAFDYATGYLMPNFYFHVVTAYSILRKNGVPIGKEDYIGPQPLKDL